MRPMVRDDAYHVAVEEGAYILTHRGAVQLSGASVSQWIDRLAPHLDGRQTLEELTAALPPDRSAMVGRLVRVLYDRGVVQDLGETPPPWRGAGDQEPDAAFVEYFRGAPAAAAAAVARYRASNVVVVGAGPVLNALVAAGRASGLSDLRIIETPGDLSGTDRARVRDAVVCGDLVWHAGGGEPAVRRAMLLERWCAESSVALAQALAVAGEVWLAAPERGGAPWTCLWPRFEAASFSAAPASDGETDPVVSAVAASQLVHAGFRLLTGAGDDAGEPAGDPDGDAADRPQSIRLTRVDPRTLRSYVHAGLPHPHARAAGSPTEAEFRRDLDRRMRAERLTEEELSQRASRCVDDRLGLLRFVDRAWAQSPLHVSEAVVPQAGDRSGASVRVVGAGFGYQTARCQAAMRALVRYAALAVDPRRLTGADGGTVWSYELADPTRVRPLPAAIAFPAAGKQDLVGRPVGAASGYDWHEAVVSGLLDHCREQAVASLEGAEAPFPLLALDAAMLGDTGRRCLAILDGIGERPDVYDLTGVVGVPTVALCTGATTVAYRAGLTLAGALDEVLLQGLRWAQAQAFHENGYAPAAVPPLPARLRGDLAEPPCEWPTMDIVEAAVRLGGGRTAVAVPLDHDPAVSGVLPHLAQVVLVDD